MRNSLIVGVLCLFGAQGVQAAGLGIEEKVSLEKTLTDKIQQIAVPFIGSSEFLVWADVTVDLSVTNTTKNRTEPDPAYKVDAATKLDDTMPGIEPEFLPPELQSKIPDSLRLSLASRPIIQEMSHSMRLPTNYIQKVRVRMMVPNTVPKERIESLKQALTVMIPIVEARGDELQLDQMTFQRDPIERFLYWKERIGTTVFWAFALLLTTAFLFGPTRSFLNRVAGTMENFEIKTTSSVRELVEQKEAKEKALTGGPAGLLTGPGGKPGEEYPFSFIRADNMNKVLWTLEGADAPTISVVAAHLAPDLSSQLIAALEPDKQKEVMLLLSSPQSVDREIVTGLNQQLKAQVDSVVGGVDHILQILDQQTPDKQHTILEELRADKPDIVEKIEGRMLTLDKVFKLDKGALQGLLWEAYRQRITLGIILKTLPKEQQQMGLSALPETLTRVVTDEMSLPTTAGQLDTERRKFMALVRNLEKSGKISFARKT